MKHLVSLSNLAPRQYEEVVALLEKHRIEFRETPVGMLAGGAIQVAEEDHPRALAILREESQEFAKEAREEWDKAWREEHGGSAVRWFLHRVRSEPVGTIGRLVLLIAMVAVFLVYPVWYVFRGAI